jgi:PIN domain nuclease of toxin-antitoxin system
MTGVLDSWAILAMLRKESAGARVAQLLVEQEHVMSSVNLGEVLYWTIRDRGEARATATVEDLRATVRVEHPDWRLVADASRIKARGGISYADAFCVATARRHGLPVYTGDPEIVQLDDENLRVVDLRSES